MVEKRRIEQDVYDTDYLLSDHTEGFEAFQKGELSLVKKKLFEMLEFKSDQSFLEIGYGRGEFMLHCRKMGLKVAGIDYAEAAYEIAKKTLKDYPDIDVRIADCRDLPYENDQFDRVFAGDVIEHLDYEDALKSLKEMQRVVKPGGIVLVHTAPNTVFTKFVYPIINPFIRIISKKTYNNFKDHMKVVRKVHIFEHNLNSLKKITKKAGMKNAKVWIDPDILRSGDSEYTKQLVENPLIKIITSVLKWKISRFFLGNDLYLKYQK